MHSPKKMGEPRNQMFLRKVQEVKKASLKSEINFSSEILSYYLNGICQEYIQKNPQEPQSNLLYFFIESQQIKCPKIYQNNCDKGFKKWI